jgi:DNA-binding response OmpR family regulator/CheY-specific phosphatase CheX
VNILVVGADVAESTRVMNALKDAGHQVHAAEDDAAALAILSNLHPQVMVLYACAPAEPLLGLVRRATAPNGAPPPSVLLLGDELPESYMARAYEAGLEGELRRGCGRDYLLARVDALGRPRAAAAATRPAPPRTPLETLGQSGAWRRSAQLITAAASKFLTLPLSSNEALPNPQGLELGCAIVLSNVVQQVEVRVALGTSQASAGHLACHMFGPGEDQLGMDVLSELANILMGTLKTALGTDGLAFTGGLPAPLPGEEVLRPNGVFALQSVVTLQAMDHRVVVHVGARTKGNLMVAPAALHEGMVLARDVFNAKGLLLLTGGTRLSTHMIEKLQNVMTPRQTVEVMLG